MLSDTILAEFATGGALQQRLVTMAWPTFETSERLQIIQAIQGRPGLFQTPD